MCPELSQDVSQDHLSRAFYPESFIYDKFDQQHTFFFNHLPHLAVYKPSEDEHMLDAEGSSSAGTRPLASASAVAAAVGQHVQPSQAVGIGMVGGGSHHGQLQEAYTVPFPPSASHAHAHAPEASTDYPLHMSCDDNHLMPEIDCGWMKEVLDDFLLTSQEMPPLDPLNIAQCSTSTINLPSLLAPLGIPSRPELPAVSPHPHLLAPSASPTERVASPRPAHVDAMQTGEQVAAAAAGGGPKSPAKSKSSSSTPEPLRTRASKRLQRDESTRKVSKWAHKANLANVDQVEHVIRERQRRDDMSYKIATLEGLLPQGPKRDRASIVHDSVQYVKSLQQRVEELRKKSAELLQTKRSTRSSSPVIANKEEVRARARTPGEESEKAFRVVNFHVQVEAGDEAVTLSNCRCNLDFLSLTMKALEQLQLDLCLSSITKMPDDTFFCVISSKARVGASAVPSSSTLALKIKEAVELKE